MKLKNMRNFIKLFYLVFVLILSSNSVMAENVIPEAKVYNETSIVNVIGQLDSTEADNIVTLLLKDTASGALKHIAETRILSDGFYRIKFKYSGDASKCELSVRQGTKDVTNTVIEAISKEEALVYSIDTQNSVTDTQVNINISNMFNIYGETYTAVIAYYDINGVLINAKLNPQKEVGFDFTEDGISADRPENTKTIKVFLWNSLEKAIPLCDAYVDGIENNISSLSIQVGADETSRRFVWYNGILNVGARLQYALKSDYDADGGFTEENSIIVVGTTEVPAGNIYNTSCKAEITDLELGTTYVYRVGNNQSFDENVYEFNTYANLDQKQSFNIVSDIHFHSETSSTTWQNTMQKMLEYTPELSFIMSTGDNVSEYNMNYYSAEQGDNLKNIAQINEKEFKNLFDAQLMKSIPFVSTLGNHEVQYFTGTNSDYVSVSQYHYNLPNESETARMLKNSNGDFWFRNGDVLVIGINDFSRTWGAMKNLSVENHANFIETACQANTDAKWRVLVNHVPGYTYWGKDTDNESTKLQEACKTYCDLYDIDVMFSGHEHAFSRTYQIYNGEVVDTEKLVDGDSITDPVGTVYYTVPAATDMGGTSVASDTDFFRAYGTNVGAAKQIDGFDGIVYSSPMFTNVTVDETGEKSAMTINVVRSDKLSAVDTYTIYKTK